MKFKALICLVCVYYRICLATSPRILYANRRDIRIVRPSPKNPNETIVVVGLLDAIAVDFSYEDGFIFWTDVSVEKIKRISMTGSPDSRKVEDVVSVGLKKPEGLAVDWVGKKLYWTDCRDSDWETNRIEVANFDGSYRKVLFWKNLGLPRAIAVDPLKGFMFWTDWGEQPKIERAEMDGSNRSIIVRQDIHWPNGLTIDYAAQKIYWTDAKLFYIAKANYDGTNRERIFKSPNQCIMANQAHPFALTLYENKIYWTDWNSKGIHAANKNNGMRCQIVLSSSNSPMDIHAYEPKRQLQRPGQNPCNSTLNGGCSHLCLLNTHGRSCACPTGVKLLSNGKTCEQGPFHFLLLARKGDLRRISLDTPDLTDVVLPVSEISHAVAIDFDPVDKYVYWSDDDRLEIKRCRLNGKDVQTVVRSELKYPDGIAVDWVARNLYWTDTGTNRIEVSRLNGSARKVLIDENLDEPRAIALDPTKGYMYWTDWGKHPKIERAELDGSHRVILVNSSVAWPNGLTIDYVRQKIYWADARNDKIEVMNYDGSARRIILDRKLPHVFGFTVLGNNLYWTDWQRRSIESVNKRTGENRKVLIEGLPDLMGLKAVNLNLSYGSNACQRNNGGCSHLCLYTPSGPKCECPTGMELLSEKKRCILPEAFLVFSNADDIRRISLETNNDLIIPLVGIKEANALDFSVHDMQIYWSDLTLKTISRAFLNGSNVQHLIAVDLSYPDGLAVDWIAKNLYWTDSKLQRIELSRLDGQHRKMLIWKDLWEPRELTLDPVSGHMYWANGGWHPMIERADLDGSNRQTIIPNVTRPTGLTIDFAAKMILWVDSENKVIECANLNGSNRQVIASELPKPFALTQFKGYIYWTDQKLGSIYRANKTNGMERTQIKGNIEFTIMDILVFHGSRQEGSNPCAFKNGGCSHLCLAKPGNRKECSCPTHYTLSLTDNKSCLAPRVFMLYSTKEDIRRILFNSSENLDVVLPVRGLSDVQAIDFDINSHRVFWIEESRIKFAYQNGSVKDNSLNLAANASPFDFAIDPYAKQLFWTDSITNSINVYSLRNNTNLGKVFKKEGVSPRSIVLYPEKGLMYFTNVGSNTKGIMKVPMAGADKVQLSKDNLRLFSADSPGDLAVDKEGKKLYWTDTQRKKIEYGDLGGTNRATLVERHILNPIGLAVYGNYVYWIDQESRLLKKIEKIGEVSEDFGKTVQASINGLTDMIVVDTRKSTDYHPCIRNHCSHICLVGDHNKAQCSCPMDMILTEDNSTCGPPKECKPNQFPCPSGVCLSKEWVCDKTPDCEPDGADEKDCPLCKDDEFACRTGGQCIDAEKVNDGEGDCDDNSDESNCSSKCQKGEFGCYDETNDCRCISLDWMCDGTADCVDNIDEMDCVDTPKNGTDPVPRPIQPSNLSGKMVAVIVASIIVGVIFLTVAVLICRRLKHGPDCDVTHDIGLVVTPVLHPRPASSASSSSSTSSRHDMFVTAPLRRGPGSAGSSHKRSKSNGTAPSLSNRSSASQTAYDRNNLTGASCSSTASTVVTAYFHEPLNPPPSPVTERSQYTSRSRQYCESLLPPSSCTSYRYHRPKMPPPPTPVSTDVESVGSRHHCRRLHRCRHKRYAASSCTEAAYDSDLFAPPPTPNTNYLSEATHFSDQEGPPPSPALTERHFFAHPYPPPPSPVTDAPSVIL